LGYAVRRLAKVELLIKANKLLLVWIENARSMLGSLEALIAD
jgi:hypothetical protein